MTEDRAVELINGAIKKLQGLIEMKITGGVQRW